jgi:hypothetical protein
MSELRWGSRAWRVRLRAERKKHLIRHELFEILAREFPHGIPPGIRKELKKRRLHVARQDSRQGES